jgi:hypothetical protein
MLRAGNNKFKLVLLSVGLLLSTHANAECLCVLTTESDLFLSADAIFVGKPLRHISLSEPDTKTEVNNNGSETFRFSLSTAPLIYVVRPNEVIKDNEGLLTSATGTLSNGTLKHAVYVLQDSTGDCGASFREGENMLFLVKKSGPQFLVTNICMGTLPLSNAEDFLGKLRKIRATLNEVDKQ